MSYDKNRGSLGDGEGSTTRPTVVSTNAAETLIETPGANDVLFGRGSPIIRWHGNVKFRELVRQRKTEYLATRRHAHKDTIAREIIEEIETNRKGRFLKRASTTAGANTEDDFLTGIPRQWMLAEEEMIIEKVKQALRDKDIDSSTRKPSSSAKKRKATDATEEAYATEEEEDAKISGSVTRARKDPMIVRHLSDAAAAVASGDDERPRQADYSATSSPPPVILPMFQQQQYRQTEIQNQLLAELQRHLLAQTRHQQQQQQLQQQQPPYLGCVADQIRRDQQQGQSWGGSSSIGNLQTLPTLNPSNDATGTLMELTRQQALLQQLLAAGPDSSRNLQQLQHQIPQLPLDSTQSDGNLMEVAAAWLRARQDAVAQEQQQQQTMQRVLQETLRWLTPAAVASGSILAIPPLTAGTLLAPPLSLLGEHNVQTFSAATAATASSTGNEEESQQGRASLKREEEQGLPGSEEHSSSDESQP